MKVRIIKILIFFFLIAFLFLNKDVELNQYYWIISFMMYATFLVDFKIESYYLMKQNIYGNRMIFLTMLGFLSLLWAPDFSVTLIHVIILSIVVLNSYVLYYFITKYDLSFYIVSAMLVYSFINYSLVFKMPLFNFLLNKDEEGTQRFVGTELNPNDLGVMLIFSIFLSLSTFTFFRNQPKFLYIIHIINILLGFYTIVLSESRTAMICSILLILFILFLKASKWIFSFKTILSFIIIIFLFFGFFNWSSLIENISPSVNRFYGMFSTISGSGTDNSTNVRLSYIKKGWEEFTQNPWVGHGINSFQYYHRQYAHNNYIELLFALGFMGPLIYYSIHFSIARRLFKQRKTQFIIGFLIALLAMDGGTVSYYSKQHMLMFVTILIFLNNVPMKKFFKANNILE